jgi:hypothetical protein
MTNNEQETNSTPEKVLIENQTEISQPTPINLCQGYLVDPETRLHLCNACEYHKWRNKSKPWLKVRREGSLLE